MRFRFARKEPEEPDLRARRVSEEIRAAWQAASRPDESCELRFEKDALILCVFTVQEEL